MAQKISVIIPSYNGQKLLAQNLPKACENCPNCQIIVVDDGSTDDSADFVRENFPQIKLIKSEKNQGFAKAVNLGVQKASGDLIILLNSDVAPRSDFLKLPLSHFKNKKVFGVGLCDLSHEKEKIIERGRGGAYFTKGFVSHFALPSEKGETLWVSGGSAIFDRQKFLELGGFDSIFAPFYWEDIDLAFRAWQKGYICLFEPGAKVDHFHEQGAIQKARSKLFIKGVSYKNQFLFVWKNISDPCWLTWHLLWFPYHFTKALLTFDIAFFFGFLWALSQIPSLIFNFQFPTRQSLGDGGSTLNFQLSDKEVLNKFAKP